MAPQQGISYVHAAEGTRLRAQVVEKWDYSRIAETAAVRQNRNVNVNSVPAGVC